MAVKYSAAHWCAFKYYGLETIIVLAKSADGDTSEVARKQVVAEALAAEPNAQVFFAIVTPIEAIDVETILHGEVLDE